LGIWRNSYSCKFHLGEKDLNGIKPSFEVNATNCPSIESLTNYSTEFMPTFRPALHHEALIYCVADKIIQLSHYNLLVNTNGLQKYLGLNRDDTFLVKLRQNQQPGRCYNFYYLCMRQHLLQVIIQK